MVVASVPVKNFDRGNSNLDSHMIEVVEGLKYPSIVFTAQSISYQGSQVTAKGELAFHGVKKPLTITGTHSLANGTLTISGKFKIDMTDFGVEPPSLMGVSTDKNIKLSYDFVFPM